MSFNIVRNDITKVSADAIVNTANPKPVYAGGTDAAIYAAAGADALLREREKIGDIAVGQSAVTSAFALNAKYIIHTVGPEWTDGEHGEKETVRSCYENSLKLAKELGCESIAFPLIATGVYGFPKDEALKIAVSVFGEFLSQEDMEITLVVFDKESFVLSDKVFSGVDEYIDDNYVESTLDEEYAADRRENDTVIADTSPNETFSSSVDSSRGRLHNLFGMFGKMGRKNEAVPMHESVAREISSDDFCDGGADEVSDEECLAEEPENSTKSDADLTGKNAGRQAAPSNAFFGASMPASAMPAASAQMARSSMCMEQVFEGPVRGMYSAGMLNVPAAEGKAKQTRSLDDLMANVSETWQESLFRLIDEKGYTDTEVYKRANVDRKLFSKIRSNTDYQPKKITAVAFALALNLNLDETKDLIGRAGYALSPSNKFDLIIEYFIENEVYDTYTINLALFEHDQPLLL